MATVAEKIAQDFGSDHGRFLSATAGNLTEVCLQQAVRIVEEFGKKKFIFADDSAVTMGDGQWFVGYGDCFCNADHGHHPQCPGSQISTQQGIVDSPVPLQPMAVPVFTIHIFGKENRTVSLEAGQHKARLDVRSLLTQEKRATHACIVDQAGVVTDAYERVIAATGDIKIKKVDPRRLPEQILASIAGE